MDGRHPPYSIPEPNSTQIFVKWEEKTVRWRLIRENEWGDFKEHISESWGDRTWRAEFGGAPWIDDTRVPENNATVLITVSLDGGGEEHDVKATRPGGVDDYDEPIRRGQMAT
jgi:hypothetical protein